MIEVIEVVAVCKKIIFKGDTGYTISLFKFKSSEDEQAKEYLDKTMSAVSYTHLK